MWIAVIGSIGVGKSKITNMIAEKFSCIQVDEKIDQKSFDLFEKNPIDFALSNQLSFISNKFKSQVELQNSERKIVSQRIFHESMIFSECLLDNELMTKKDFDMFSTVFKSMASVLKPPSIVVYLKADTMTTHYRKEMNESRCLFTQDEYIKDLNEKYDKFVSTLACPLVEVKMGENFDHAWDEIEYGISSVETSRLGASTIWNTTLQH